jgi:hypothetical protein
MLLSRCHPAQIRFESALAGYPFEEGHPSWRKASMERRNSPTDLNYRSEGNQGRPYDAGGMRGLQVKQPFSGDGGENALIFDVPTTGLDNVFFRFAVVDEGAADAILVDYSTRPEDVGWTTSGLEASRFPLSDQWQNVGVHFGHISEVQDNRDFKIRLRFEGSDMHTDRGNRVTFNNISLDTLSAVSTSSDTDGLRSIASFQLDQNYPNPFNPTTSITFSLPERSPVTLTVYNAVGQRVAVLIDSDISAGRHSVTFDASDLASGLYLYRIQAGDFREARRMVLVK